MIFFCIVTLFPATFLKIHLLILGAFLEGSLVYSVEIIILSMNRASFTSFFPIWLLFLSYCSSWEFNTVLNRTSGDLFTLLLILGKKHSLSCLVTKSCLAL